MVGMGVPGERRVTIADVARAGGVSRTTVSHALNGVGRVDPGTRERLRLVAAELGYRPNLRAQRLRRGRARQIGLVSSMPYAVAAGPARLGFYMEVAAAAAETALTAGFALVLAPPLESGLSLDFLDIDGAIVVEPTRDDVVTASLLGRGLPVITLGAQLGTELAHVDLGGAAVGGLLLGHLFAQGARHIALLVGDSQRHSYVTLRSTYDRFVAEHGMASVVAAVSEEGGEEAGYAGGVRLLGEHPEVDAVCVAVDAFAVGCVRAVQDAGRRVPEDVLVVTRYDGVLARTCAPPLTAVNLHLGEVASVAVAMLLTQLGAGSVQGPGRVPGPVLVARRSSQPSVESGWVRP